MSLFHATLLASATTTTTFDPHKGSVLPAARFIVLAVPIFAGFFIWLRMQPPKKK